MRLLLTGGGTAGHINPAVAIANILSQKEIQKKLLRIAALFQSSVN